MNFFTSTDAAGETFRVISGAFVVLISTPPKLVSNITRSAGALGHWGVVRLQRLRAPAPRRPQVIPIRMNRRSIGFVAAAILACAGGAAKRDTAPPVPPVL